MIKVGFRVNSRDVPPHRVGDAIGDLLLSQIQDAVTDHVNRRIGSLRCRVHGQAPRVTAAPGGSSPDSWTLTVEGCCEAFQDQATRSLQ